MVLAQKAVAKGPERPSYGNLGKFTQNPHFLKKFKGGRDQGKFFKTRPGSSPRLNGLRALWRKTGKDSGANSGIKSYPMANLCNFCKVTQNPHFLK